MKNSSLFIPILLGTLRQGRYSENVAKYVQSRLERIDKVKTQIIDPREMNLSREDYGPGIADRHPEYAKLIEQADGLIIVTPEYNHGYPGTLKEVLDLEYGAYNHKACGIVGVSKGGFGGTRVIEHLAQVVKALGMVMSKKDLNVLNVQDDFFTKAGKPKDKRFQEFTDGFLQEIVWLARAMKWGRKNLG